MWLWTFFAVLLQKCWNASHWQCWKALKYHALWRGWSCWKLVQRKGNAEPLSYHLCYRKWTPDCSGSKRSRTHWGSKSFSQFLSLLRRTGQKQQEKDNQRLPTPTTEKEEFRGQIWLFISNFHVSLRQITCVSSVMKTTTSAGKLITPE